MIAFLCIIVALFVLALFLDVTQGSVLFWMAGDYRSRGAYIRSNPFGERACSKSCR